MLWRVTVNAPGPNDGANWRIRYKAPSGRVNFRTSKTKDRAKAEAFAQREEARLNSVSELATILDVVDAYLVWAQPDLAPQTLRNYHAARAVLAPLLNVPPSKMGPGWVEDVFAALGTRRASTKYTHLYVLAAAWSWAHERGQVSRPWVMLKRRRRKTRARSTIKRPLTPEALVDTLRAARRSGYFALFWALADTGCRLSEVLQGTVDGDWLRVRSSKTGEPRAIPLLPDTRSLLLEGFARSTSEARRVWRRALEQAGVSNEPDLSGARAVYPVDIHSLRRTWIAHSERAGVPRPVAMRITGHELQGVHDLYGRHYGGDDLHAALRKIRDFRPGLTQVLEPGF